jgi:hypothetical protein
MNDCKQVAAALAAPFDPSEVKFKPAVVSGNRALALPYVDARVIQDRLDEVLGVCGWQDEYDVLPDGSVVCKLRCKIDGEWVTKTDVGGPSEQPDEGDRRKAAFSDALKRAAVKWGVGRYLYRLPSQWVDYDPQKKQFAKKPALILPASFKPVAASGNILARLQAFDERLVKARLCMPGECVEAVRQLGIKAGYPADLSAWPERALGFATQQARAFEAKQREKGEKQS